MSSSGDWPASESSLICQLCDRENATAWETFAAIYPPIIFRYCRRRGLQDSDAQDVTATVISRVLEHVEKYDRDKGRFRDWLGRIAHNEICNHWRRNGRPGQQGIGGEETPDFEEEDDGAATAWLEEFCPVVLQTAMERVQPAFDPEAWQAFTLAWVDEVSPAEVARRLGRSASWVHKKKFLILNRLKAEIAFLTDDHPFIS